MCNDGRFEVTNQKRKITHDLAIGQIVLAVKAEGPIDDRDQAVDYMLGIASSALSHSLSALKPANLEKGTFQQTCIQTVQFGDISYTMEIQFDLKHKMSWTDINSQILAFVLTQVNRAAGTYLGNAQSVSDQRVVDQHFQAIIAAEGLSGDNQQAMLAGAALGGYGVDPLAAPR